MIPDGAGAEAKYMDIDPSTLDGKSMREKLSVWQDKYEVREAFLTNKTSTKDTDKGVDKCLYFDDENNIRGKSEIEDELQEDESQEEEEQTINNEGDPLEGLAYDINTLFYHPGDMIEIL